MSLFESLYIAIFLIVIVFFVLFCLYGCINFFSLLVKKLEERKINNITKQS